MEMVSTFFLLFIACNGWLLCSEAIDVNVKIDVENVINTVDERYLSITLEASIFKKHWGTFNVRSAKLHTLSSALSPAYLRVGGSSCDFLYFNKTAKHTLNGKKKWQDTKPYIPAASYKKIKSYLTGPSQSSEDFEGDVFLEHHKNYTNFTMTAHDWDTLNKFAERVGWRVMFDLNVFTRKGQNWDPSNVLDILDYTIKQNYTSNIDWQLGNEPSAYPHAFNVTISAPQLGKDFLTLYNLIRNDTRYQQFFKHSLLVGPDITRPKERALEYLKDYLQTVGKSVNAVTWHHYYVDGRTATVQDFTNYKTLDTLVPMLKAIDQAVKDMGLSSLPQWMGETSSAWGGGAKGLSDRFVAGFMWLDKLGLASQMKQKVVTRQSLYGGHYALLDESLFPLPDYWLSVIYKRLVGRQVFQTQIVNNAKNVRVYAHCTAQNPSRSGSFNAGSITIYAVNLGMEQAELILLDKFQEMDKRQYILTSAGSKQLQSKYVKLNGKKLKMLNDYLLPKMGGKLLAAGQPILLPPYSLGFFVIDDASVKACTIKY